MVGAAAARGDQLGAALAAALGDHPRVGDIRGLGLLRAVELVADRDSRAPFPRSDRVTERVVAACAEHGVLVYSSTGCADGTDGDLLVLGPPLVITEAEVDELVSRCAAAVRSVLD